MRLSFQARYSRRGAPSSADQRERIQHQHRARHHVEPVEEEQAQHDREQAEHAGLEDVATGPARWRSATGRGTGRPARTPAPCAARTSAISADQSGHRRRIGDDAPHSAAGAGPASTSQTISEVVRDHRRARQHALSIVHARNSFLRPSLHLHAAYAVQPHADRDHIHSATDGIPRQSRYDSHRTAVRRSQPPDQQPGQDCPAGVGQGHRA